MATVKRYQVSAHEAGIKLQRFLKERLGDVSTRKVKGFIDRNHCRVNGRLERFGCTGLQRGDQVEFIIAEQPTSSPELPVFEDDHLLVINKAVGLVSTEVGRACHRLDRDTSGLLILAKSQPVADQMADLFRSRSVQKRYLALVDGVPEEGSGEIANRLGPVGSFDGQTLYGATSEGKGAVTKWEVVKAGREASLLACAPETGRTHQIRVHLAGMGHPILGDGQYCRDFVCRLPVVRQMLHAEKLRFVHPVTGEHLLLRARPPNDFREMQAACGC